MIKPFRTIDLLTEQANSAVAYLEFLRVNSMSLGFYTLPVGGVDPQQPHTEDEIYYVVGGKAKIQIAEEVFAVELGSIVYVEKLVEHHFFDIEETLITLVFFAPAEGSLKES